MTKLFIFLFFALLNSEYNVTYRILEWFGAHYEDIFRHIEFQNLEELHFSGFDFDFIWPETFSDDILGILCKNLPKLQRLYFQIDNFEILVQDPEYDQIAQKFASENNVKIEIAGTPVYRTIVEVEHPLSGFKIFKPIPK